MKELTYFLFAGATRYYEANSGLSFGDLKRKVATPKGTTEAGLDELPASKSSSRQSSLRASLGPAS